VWTRDGCSCSATQYDVGAEATCDTGVECGVFCVIVVLLFSEENKGLCVHEKTVHFYQFLNTG
jgi:hypothetical protein